MITISEIIKILSGKYINIFDFPITEAVIDSRKAIPGSIFFALEGETTDGHHYIESAFNHGALVAVISKDINDKKINIIDLRKDQRINQHRFPKPPYCLRVNNSLETLQNIAKHWRKTLPIKVTGITGSVGKSSTKELTADVLSVKYRTFKNPGNYNNEIGLPLSILNLGKGYERLVLEMGFYYPGEITFLCEIAKPQIGVVTNVGTVHAERAGSQQAIAEGKAELVAALPKKPFGTAILNYDDPLVKAMAGKTTADVLYYGLNPAADIWADQIQGRGLKGIRFRIHYRGQSTLLDVPFLGRHSVQTILRASAVGFTEGLSIREITEGLIHSNSHLRLIAVRTQNGALILDDTYNATPESTIAALDLLSELKGKKIAVLGDMLELGQYEEIGHKSVGIRAAQIVNYLITVGPRGKIIAETAKQKGLPPTAVVSVDNALGAAELLRYNLRQGDVVLVKGSHGLHMDRISKVLEGA
ncbi:MAG: UDP-N-acetylmuramoyl-tripeptide--D-alanyl-D-alanine ligase [Anaerolineaceae bacterium]|nr:UDP-N-acetylmuramoyl-tripeptide--D-alanyl-D-alanine ligase [Anaerolineaceae bacterium]